MIGVSFAHDVVEWKCFSFLTVYFVNLIILFIVFGSDNTTDGNECVELIATPNTLRLKSGTNSIAKEFKLIRWSCLSRFLDCKASIVISLNLINAEWIFEIERECFVLEGVSDMKLTVILLCKLEDPIFKIGSVCVFFALWNFGLAKFETYFVNVLFSPLEILTIEPLEAGIVILRTLHTLQEFVWKWTLAYIFIFGMIFSSCKIKVKRLHALKSWYQFSTLSRFIGS